MLGHSAFEVTALSGFDVYKQSRPVQLLYIGGFHPQGPVGPLGQGVEVVVVTAGRPSVRQNVMDHFEQAFTFFAVGNLHAGHIRIQVSKHHPIR